MSSEMTEQEKKEWRKRYILEHPKWSIRRFITPEQIKRSDAQSADQKSNTSEAATNATTVDGVNVNETCLANIPDEILDKLMPDGVITENYYLIKEEINHIMKSSNGVNVNEQQD